MCVCVCVCLCVLCLFLLFFNERKLFKSLQHIVFFSLVRVADEDPFTGCIFASCRFLKVDVSSDIIEKIVEHTSFNNMKANPTLKAVVRLQVRSLSS